ncbi:hypothetical protein BH09PSE1_BH09PSE1_28250 [soil metagenome]
MIPGRTRACLAAAAVAVLTGCATTPEPPAPRVACSGGDKPMAERVAYVREWLTKAYVAAPPLSREEKDRMSRLAACHGAGVGACEEWEATRASGLYDRYILRSGEYSIPDLMLEADRQTDRSARIRNLVTAHSVVWEAREHFAERRERGLMTPEDWQAASTALFIAGGAVEDALVCEASRPG